MERGFGDEGGGLGAERRPALPVVVVEEVAVDDEGDLDRRDLPLADAVGLPAAAARLLPHRRCKRKQREKEERE